MSKENKIAIVILCVGLIAIAIYWFLPQGTPVDKKLLAKHAAQEQIILPQYEKSTYQNIPEVQHYMSDIRAMIREGRSVLPLPSSELDNNGKKAQEILLQNSEFLDDTTLHGKLMHNDMMRIIPAIVSAMDTKVQNICKNNPCYQAEKYNFVTNTTTRAIVDIDNKTVLAVERYNDMQPDISLRLKHIAQAIALHAPEVKQELGFTPLEKDITMANIRGTMKESPCENTEHLCVAPTFADHKREQALWAVVDLTEMRLAAAKWAGLGKTTTPACIGERSLQNRYIMENFCQKDNYLEKNGWKITYRLTGSDGLEVRDVRFKGESVLKSAKIVDWHVSYQQKGNVADINTSETYIEGRRVEYVQGDEGKFLFGYNDAMGCPLFSTSVVLAFNGPQVKDLASKDGFMLTQDFRNPKWPMACNYRYENRFEFYNDGSFRIVGANKGRGCGDNALYRPVMRIDMAIADQEDFYSYDASWKLWDKEHSEHVATPDANTTHPYPYKIVSASNPNRGYYIEPNHGQFGDNSRGDDATLFMTTYKPDEGDKDLLTLGSCCDLNDDGVGRYLSEPEKASHSDIVLWYVPRIRNDARAGHEYCWADTVIGEDGNLEIKEWPCIVGPKFVPIHKGAL